LLDVTPLVSRRWAGLARIDNRLTGWVAAAPVTVRTKLLVAFLAIAGLLVLVSVLGLQVLAQANARVERLSALQLRSSTYQALEAYATDLEQTLGVRAAGTPSVTPYTGGKTLQGGEQWVLADLQVADALSQVELGSDEALFGFVPPAAEERALRRIRADYRNIVSALAHRQLDRSDVTGFRAEPYIRAAIDADNDLAARTASLGKAQRRNCRASCSEPKRIHLVTQPLHRRQCSESSSRSPSGLASWSLIRPIQRTEARLAEIASRLLGTTRGAEP
jgi:hypothetical protein